MPQVQARGNIAAAAAVATACMPWPSRWLVLSAAEIGMSTLKNVANAAEAPVMVLRNVPPQAWNQTFADSRATAAADDMGA